MNQNLKQKWIKALRSGRYKQTTEKLKDNNGYCCLGVLCQVVGAKWSSYGIPKLNGENLSPHIKTLLTPGVNMLTSKFLKKIKLTKNEQIFLANMNDGINQTKRSFDYIADYIEKNL